MGHSIAGGRRPSEKRSDAQRSLEPLRHETYLTLIYIVQPSFDLIIVCLLYNRRVQRRMSRGKRHIKPH